MKRSTMKKPLGTQSSISMTINLPMIFQPAIVALVIVPARVNARAPAIASILAIVDLASATESIPIRDDLGNHIERCPVIETEATTRRSAIAFVIASEPVIPKPLPLGRSVVALKLILAATRLGSSEAVPHSPTCQGYRTLVAKRI